MATKLVSVVVCELMKDLKRLRVKAGSTIQEVLVKAGIYVEGKMERLRVNGEIKTLGAKVKKDDIITLVPQVDGGR